jgi:hypothetical protein
MYRDWTGVRVVWRNWWKVWPRKTWIWDMRTNSGYNNYEEKLHTFRFSIWTAQWYTLT